MRSYSPTSLRVFTENCPAALEHYLNQKKESLLAQHEWEVEGPYMAEVGIAFHAIVHQAGLQRSKGLSPHAAMEAMALTLTKRIAPDRVNLAYEMAKEFVIYHEFPEGFSFEHGVAFDAQWQPVAWDSDQRKLRLIFDAVGCMQIEEDRGELMLAVAQDYKTGWAVKADELESIQMDAYLTVLPLIFPEADALRIQIIATRFNQTYEKTFLLCDDEDVAELQKRKNRLKFYLKSADLSDGTARVGSGCINCNWSTQCKAFSERLAQIVSNSPSENTSPVELARDLAVVESRMKELEVILKEHAKNSGLIRVDQKTLGFNVGEERRLMDAAKILEVFLRANPSIKLDDGQRAAMRGLIISMDPGVTTFDDVVKACAKQLGYKTKKEALEEESKGVIKTQQSPRWGWRKAELEQAS